MDSNDKWDDDGGNESLWQPIADMSLGAFAIVFLMFVIAALVMSVSASEDLPDEKALEIKVVWDISLPSKQSELPESSVQYMKIIADGGYVKPGHSTADIDMWMYYEDKAGACQIIGFEDRWQSSKFFKQDKDDLGWKGQDVLDDVNEEYITTRISKLPPGKYQVSLHLYSTRDEMGVNRMNPIVSEFSINLNKGMSGAKSWQFNVPLYQYNQEVGVMFMVDEEGRYVEGSFVELTEDIRIKTDSSKLQRCANWGGE